MPKVKDSFEQLNKDLKLKEVYPGCLVYRFANGSIPCYTTRQQIPPGKDGVISDEHKRRYITLCRDAAIKDTLVIFSVTAKEPSHKEWINVFCEYMDEGATLMEAKSKHDGRYKCWMFIIHAKKMK